MKKEHQIQVQRHLILAAIGYCIMALAIPEQARSQGDSLEWLRTAGIQAHFGSSTLIDEAAITDSCLFIYSSGSVIVVRRIGTDLRFVDTVRFSTKIDQMVSISDTCLLVLTDNKLIGITPNRVDTLEWLPDGTKSASIAATHDFMVMAIPTEQTEWTMPSTTIRLYAIKNGDSLVFINARGAPSGIYEIAINGNNVIGTGVQFFDGSTLSILTIKDAQLTASIYGPFVGGGRFASSLSISETHFSFRPDWDKFLVYELVDGAWQPDPISFGPSVSVQTLSCQNNAVYALCSEFIPLMGQTVTSVRVYRKDTVKGWVLAKTVYPHEGWQLIVDSTKIFVVDIAGYQEYERSPNEGLRALPYRSVYPRTVCLAADGNRIVFARGEKIFSATALPNRSLVLVDSLDAIVTSLHFQQPNRIVASGRSALLLSISESGMLGLVDSIPLPAYTSRTRSAKLDNMRYAVASIFEGAVILTTVGDSLMISKYFGMPIVDVATITAGHLLLVSVRDSVYHLYAKDESISDRQSVAMPDTNARILRADMSGDTLFLLMKGSVSTFRYDMRTWRSTGASNVGYSIENFEVGIGCMWMSPSTRDYTRIWEMRDGKAVQSLQSLDGRFFGGPVRAGGRFWTAGGIGGLFELGPQVSSVEVTDDSDGKLQVYPSPASDYVQVEYGGHGARYVCVVAMNGVIHNCTDLPDESEGSTVLDLGGLPSGSYIVSILNESHVLLESRSLTVVHR